MTTSLKGSGSSGEIPIDPTQQKGHAPARSQKRKSGSIKGRSVSDANLSSRSDRPLSRRLSETIKEAFKDSTVNLREKAIATPMKSMTDDAVDQILKKFHNKQFMGYEFDMGNPDDFLTTADLMGDDFSPILEENLLQKVSTEKDLITRSEEAVQRSPGNEEAINELKVAYLEKSEQIDDKATDLLMGIHRTIEELRSVPERSSKETHLKDTINSQITSYKEFVQASHGNLLEEFTKELGQLKQSEQPSVNTDELTKQLDEVKNKLKENKDKINSEREKMMSSLVEFSNEAIKNNPDKKSAIKKLVNTYREQYSRTVVNVQTRDDIRKLERGIESLGNERAEAEDKMTAGQIRELISDLSESLDAENITNEANAIRESFERELKGMQEIK